MIKPSSLLIFSYKHFQYLENDFIQIWGWKIIEPQEISEGEKNSFCLSSYYL